MKLHERRIFLGWFVGWFYYMILAHEVAADTGPIAFPFQAIIGGVFSIIGLGIAALIGLALRISSLGTVWYQTKLIAGGFIIIPTVILIAFFDSLGPTPAYLGQLLVVFGALHFPRLNPEGAQSGRSRD